MLKKKLLTLASGNLCSELMRAAIVVGAGTTVLEEAMIVGAPAVSIAAESFLSYASDLVECFPIEDFNVELIEQAIRSSQGRSEAIKEIGRETFGLNLPLFSLMN